ncbi:F-box protein SKIP23 isoform X2 [Macadamia integrifolia]|uniref:F-box protein SKIP23 isoform X2 n=1 Tax=Macadamia integrifolia TaxID=60698 RepID=UPI001C4F9FE8|nr:F-box protein SKIP23 isoform X2 [Macadamia integrifolia]
MTDWSQLPRDVVEVIARRLTTYFDALRFRAVCSSWRSAVSQSPHRLPCHFPIVPNEGFVETTCGFYLSKRTIYRLGLPEDRISTCIGSSEASDGWLIKVEEDVPDMMHLLNPLTETQIKPLPSMFPKVLDLSDLRISELGQDYVLQYINYRPFVNSFVDAGSLYMEKVAFFSSNSSLSASSPADDNDKFALLTIHVSGKLAMFKSGDEKWTIIEDQRSPYDDVICFKGKFYAVDSMGRIVIVEPSATVTLIASHESHVFGGDKKYLVESEGDLLLVDLYLSMDTGDDSPFENMDIDDDFYERIESYIVEKTVRFKVYKLYEGRQNWVELQSLGDRLLFLGDNCSFSASACDFPGCKGNRIYFTDAFNCSNGEDDYGFKDVGVFNLDDGCIGPLASYPGYSKLFWPPPSWIADPSAGTNALPD